MAIDDPVAAAAIVNAAAAKALNRLMVDAVLKMQAQPVADVEQAARVALMGCGRLSKSAGGGNAGHR